MSSIQIASGATSVVYGTNTVSSDVQIQEYQKWWVLGETVETLTLHAKLGKVHQLSNGQIQGWMVEWSFESGKTRIGFGMSNSDDMGVWPVEVTVDPFAIYGGPFIYTAVAAAADSAGGYISIWLDSSYGDLTGTWWDAGMASGGEGLGVDLRYTFKRYAVGLSKEQFTGAAISSSEFTVGYNPNVPENKRENPASILFPIDGYSVRAKISNTAIDGTGLGLEINPEQNFPSDPSNAANNAVEALLKTHGEPFTFNIYSNPSVPSFQMYAYKFHATAISAPPYTALLGKGVKTLAGKSGDSPHFFYTWASPKYAEYVDIGGSDMRTVVRNLQDPIGNDPPSSTGELKLFDWSGTQVSISGHTYSVDYWDGNSCILMSSVGDLSADFLDSRIKYVGYDASLAGVPIMFYDYFTNQVWTYTVGGLSEQEYRGWFPHNAVTISQYSTTLNLAPRSLPSGTLEITKQGTPATPYDVSSTPTTYVWLAPHEGNLGENGSAVFAPLDYIEYQGGIPTTVTGVTTIDNISGTITFTEMVTVEATGDLTLDVQKISNLDGAGNLVTVKPNGKLKLSSGRQITVDPGTLYVLAKA